MILVTGAAGYIGSHTLRQLRAAGQPIIALDNFYSGHRWAIPSDVPLITGSFGDRQLMDRVLQEHKIKSVVHFAAHILVPESVSEPLKYYRNNTANALELIEACGNAGVSNFIFSSTCAVYGDVKTNPVSESHPTGPISPYGCSKWMTECLLRDVASSGQYSMKHVILRYFNVAGACVEGGLGQSTPGSTALIKVACQVALGKRPKLLLYGEDYATPDGTCIRDYIHVDDLAQAHVLALRYLEQGGQSELFNCGYGYGYSVKEIIQCVKKVSGRDFPVEVAARRPGDAPAIFSDSTKIRSLLGWKPRFNDLELICRTALDWERSERA